MKPYKANQVVAILEKDGWRLVKTKGSHRHFKHPHKAGKVTVPYTSGNKDIKIGTLRSILRQAGIKFKDF